MTTRTTRTTPLGQDSPTDCLEHSDNGALIGPVSVRVVEQSRNMNTRTKSKVVRVVEPWPPPEYALPDSIAEIEAGRPPQQRLLFEPDDSREERVRRILGSVEGVVTANRLPTGRRGGQNTSFRYTNGNRTPPQELWRHKNNLIACIDL